MAIKSRLKPARRWNQSGLNLGEERGREGGREGGKGKKLA